MEGSKQEISEDVNDGMTGVKRVLRSRIIEVDSNLDNHSASNGVDSDTCGTYNQKNETADSVTQKENLVAHSTPIKRYLRSKASSCSSNVSEKDEVPVCGTGGSTVKNSDVKEALLKTASPEGKRLTNLNEETELTPSSPVSQCGSECSNVSVRVLRNSKCVVIPLEFQGKAPTVGNNDVDIDVKSKKNILSSVQEEKEEEENADDERSKEENDKNCANKDNVVNSDSVAVDENTLIEKDKIVENVDVSSENVCVSEKEIDEPKELTEDEVNEAQPTNVVDSIADNDDGKESEIVSGESKGCDECPVNRILLDDVSHSSPELQNEEVNNLKDSLEEKSNDNSCLRKEDDVDENIGSDTTEECELNCNLKNITKRKPIIEKLAERCKENDSQELQNRTVDTDEISVTIEESEGMVKPVLENDESILSETVETVLVEGCAGTVSIEEIEKSVDEPVPVRDEPESSNLEQEEPVTVEEVEDSVSEMEDQECIPDQSTKSRLEELQEQTEERCEKRDNVDCTTEPVNVNSSTSKNNEIRKSAKRFENILTDKNTKSDCSGNEKSKSRVNLSNVLNLLGVDKNQFTTVTLDSSSDSEGEPSPEPQKMRKKVSVETNPVQYHGIGKDLLQDIVKEAVSSAVGVFQIKVEEELNHVKQQLQNVTCLLNEMKRGKKRKLSNTNFEESDEDNDDAVRDNDDNNSLVSSSSIGSTVDVIVSKVAATPSISLKATKTKEDMIKELLDDVSDHLQLPVGEKKKKKKVKKFITYNGSEVTSENMEINKRKNKKIKLAAEKKESVLINAMNKNNVVEKFLSMHALKQLSPMEGSSSKCLNKKKKRKNLSKVQEASEIEHGKVGESNFNALTVNDGDEVSSKLSNKEKKNKKKKKINSFPVSNDLKPSRYLPDNILSLPDGPTKKNKKKKSSNVENLLSEMNTSVQSEVYDIYENVFTSNNDETGKKKLKKNKNKLNSSGFESNLNTKLKFSSVDDSNQLSLLPNKKNKNADNFSTDVGNSSSLKKIKKKKKKQNIQGNGGSFANYDADLGSNKKIGVKSNNFQDEERLLKKMESWKSTNKNQSYRATPYKNKKMKFDSSINSF